MTMFYKIYYLRPSKRPLCPRGYAGESLKRMGVSFSTYTYWVVVFDAQGSRFYTPRRQMDEGATGNSSHCSFAFE